MTKYHISKNGTPGVCHAVNAPCPLGGADKHFTSPESAQKAADIMHSEEFIGGDITPQKATIENLEKFYETASLEDKRIMSAIGTQVYYGGEGQSDYAYDDEMKAVLERAGLKGYDVDVKQIYDEDEDFDESKYEKFDGYKPKNNFLKTFPNIPTFTEETRYVLTKDGKSSVLSPSDASKLIYEYGADTPDYMENVDDNEIEDTYDLEDTQRKDLLKSIASKEEKPLSPKAQKAKDDLAAAEKELERVQSKNGTADGFKVDLYTQSKLDTYKRMRDEYDAQMDKSTSLDLNIVSGAINKVSMEDKIETLEQEIADDRQRYINDPERAKKYTELRNEQIKLMNEATPDSNGGKLLFKNPGKSLKFYGIKRKIDKMRAEEVELKKGWTKTGAVDKSELSVAKARVTRKRKKFDALMKDE